MNDENMKLNEEKIILAYHDHLEIHLVLKDNSWRNGYVESLNHGFFMFVDRKNGKEPIFFLEVHNVEPARKEEWGK